MNIKELINMYIVCRFDKKAPLQTSNRNYKEDLLKKGYINPKHYLKDNSEFFCFENTETKYFIFLGSNDIKDWFYNFFFFKREIPYKNSGTNPKIRVHSGFFEMYFKIRNNVLKEAKETNKKIVLMGHSLGSAITTFAALDIQYNTNKTVYALITGTPKVGNKYFKNSYNKRVPETIRVVKGKDLFSHLPPSIFGFRHVSKKYYHLASQYFFAPIRDHNIREYERFF